MVVDKENKKAIHVYEKCGFHVEGELLGEFFVHGVYRDAVRMCTFQTKWLAARQK